MKRIIWMLWFQGIEQAPLIVQHCVLSWKRHHPDWDCIVLDEETLKGYINIEYVVSRNKAFITAQARANIVRLHLLRSYGGVWVDATCYCMRPLSTWLPSYMNAGFFAFRDPGKDRIMSNWFLAAEQGSYIISKLTAEVDQYWIRNSFAGRHHRIGRRVRVALEKYAMQSASRCQIWFHPLIMKVFKIYPLFWFHYLFARIVDKDALFCEQWQNVAKYPAKNMLLVQRHGQTQPPDDFLRNRIKDVTEPMYKLSWKKAATEGIIPGSVLDYLFQI